jgi:hypothetical protein
LSMATSVQPGMTTGPTGAAAGALANPSTGRRWASAAMSWTAAALSGFSAFLAWWTVVIPSDSSISFRPGENFAILLYTTGTSSSIPYAWVAWSPIEALYVSVFALAGSLLVLGAISGTLLALTALGRVRAGSVRVPLRTLLLVTLLLSVFAVAIVPALQPALVDRSGIAVVDLCNIMGASPGPCHSFWGSAQSSSGVISWGPDDGWFVMLAAVVFYLVSLLLWSTTGREPGIAPAPPSTATSVPPT